MSTRKLFGVSLSRMQANIDTLVRAEEHFTTLLCADEMMFTYAGLPETVQEKFIEDYLCISGNCAWCKGTNLVTGESGLFIAPYASRAGQLDQYGDGKELTAYTPNGITLRGEIGKDCFVMYNNTARSPELDLIFDSQILTEIEKSTNSNVLFARIAPIFAAADDTTKTAIKEIIENVIAGNLETVVSQNITDMLGIVPDGSIKVLDVFQHPERVQYTQYLSQLYDVIMRRHFSKRGLTIKTPQKAAQQSVDEIHGMDSVSWYYPLNKLKARQDALKEINRIFGTNITVDFSEIWKQEHEAYLLRILQKDEQAENEMKGGETDVSLSDISPDETGNTDTDNTEGV